MKKQEIINFINNYSGVLNIDMSLFGMFGCSKKRYEETDNIGLVYIDDVIFEGWGIDDSIVAQAMEKCKKDEKKKIIFVLDTPGGSALENDKINASINQFKKNNPEIEMVSFVNGYCGSAGYSIASNIGKIFVNPALEIDCIGSIGSMIQRQDWTRSLEKDGVSVTLYTSGKKKAYSSPYLPLSKEEDDWQRQRNEKAADSFFKEVSKARGLSVEFIKALEAGVFTPKKALKIGLIDEIISFDDLIEKLQNDTDIANTTITANINNDNHLAKSDDSMEIKELQDQVKALTEQLSNATKELDSYKAKEKDALDKATLVTSEKATLEASLNKANESLNKVIKEKRDAVECAYQAFTGTSLKEGNKDLYEAIQNETDIEMLNLNIKKFQAYGSATKVEGFTKEAESPTDEEKELSKLDNEAASKVKVKGGLA